MNARAVETKRVVGLSRRHASGGRRSPAPGWRAPPLSTMSFIENGLQFANTILFVLRQQPTSRSCQNGHNDVKQYQANNVKQNITNKVRQKQTGEVLATFYGHTDAVRGLAVVAAAASVLGSTMSDEYFSVSDDNSIRKWTMNQRICICMYLYACVESAMVAVTLFCPVGYCFCRKRDLGRIGYVCDGGIRSGTGGANEGPAFCTGSGRKRKE